MRARRRQRKHHTHGARERDDPRREEDLQPLQVMVIRKLLSKDIDPLKKSIPRPDFDPGPRQGGGDGQPRVVKMPNVSLVMPVKLQVPIYRASSPAAQPNGHTVDPMNYTAQDPSKLLGPDPRLPSQGKVFGSPPLHAVPPRGGRLALSPQSSIPEVKR